MKHTYFFTGFPGFISHQLIKELLKKDDCVDKIYLLVLPHQVMKAEEDIKRIQESLVGSAIQFKVVQGDITKTHLDILPQQSVKLRTEITHVFHLAAIYDLAVDEKTAQLVNVRGTENVNDWVKGLIQLERYVYFSTAYVAGTREGVLYENELVKPSSFKNHYEETKYEAEVIVEKLKRDVQVTIIRPGIVRGHSATGETVKFDGPYFFMNLIDRIKWMPIIPYVGKSLAHINVVPIDYIIEASVYLAGNKEAAGKTVHLTDPASHPVEEVYRTMVIELTGKEPKGRFPRQLAEIGLTSKRLQRKLGVEAETLDYLSWSASFDTTIAEHLLLESGIHCADFIESIPMMVDFYNKNKSNPGFHIAIG